MARRRGPYWDASSKRARRLIITDIEQVISRGHDVVVRVSREEADDPTDHGEEAPIPALTKARS